MLEETVQLVDFLSQGVEGKMGSTKLSTFIVYLANLAIPLTQQHNMDEIRLSTKTTEDITMVKATCSCKHDVLGCSPQRYSVDPLRRGSGHCPIAGLKRDD